MQKVRHKIAYDRDSLLTKIADKIAVKHIVAKIIGREYLTKAYAATSNSDEIDWKLIPREFVAKSNH